MHPNEVPLVRQASTNPELLVPTKQLTPTLKAAKRLSKAHEAAALKGVGL